MSPVRLIGLSGGIGAVASIVAGVLMAGFGFAAPAANAIPNAHCGDGENYDQVAQAWAERTFLILGTIAHSAPDATPARWSTPVRQTL